MPLIVDMLEKVKRSAGGTILARCPACSAAGLDKAGDHLKIFPSGKFACVVNPGKEGKAHRQEIFRIVGRKESRPPPPLLWKLKLADPSRTTLRG